MSPSAHPQDGVRENEREGLSSDQNSNTRSQAQVVEPGAPRTEHELAQVSNAPPPPLTPISPSKPTWPALSITTRLPMTWQAHITMGYEILSQPTVPPPSLARGNPFEYTLSIFSRG